MFVVKIIRMDLYQQVKNRAEIARVALRLLPPGCRSHGGAWLALSPLSSLASLSFINSSCLQLAALLFAQEKEDE